MASYGLTLYAAPTAEPLTLDEAKVQCGVAGDVTYHNEKLEALVKAAREKVETDTGRALMSQTWDMTFDLWPCGLGPIFIPKSPVSAITHIKYYDTSNVQQTLNTSVYKTLLDREPAEIRLKNAQSWPSLYGETGVCVVRFVCGYASALAVPASLKQAIHMLVTHWFENRSPNIIGTINSDLQLTYNALITKWIVGDEFHSYSRSYAYA